jgi:DNA-binding transcriptional ArsR family regulator
MASWDALMECGTHLCHCMRMHARNDESFGPIDPEFIELAAEVLALLSDPTRVRILLALEEQGEMAVGELSSAVDKPRSGVSQHLARLRMARMVTTRHEGTKVLYKLIDEHPTRVIREAVRQAEHAVATGSQVPRHHSATA